MGTLSHYRNLMRGLGPAALAWAVVRRANRAAHIALHRPRGWDARKLAAEVGLPLEAAAARLLEGGAHTAWCDPQRRKSVVAAIERISGARTRAMERARTAASRSFDLFGTELRFGRNEAIDWSAGRRADPKIPWALGRLDQLVWLAQGWWVARSAVPRAMFVSELIAQTRDFLQANPPGHGIHWTNPMEVSLRAANLAQGLAMLRDVPEVRDAAFALPVLAAIVEHCEFVAAHREDGVAVPNNHLAADYLGLLVVAALLPNLPGAAHWASVGARGLRGQMEAQVHPDGCSFEGSVPYHRLAVELFTLGLFAARAREEQLGGAYADRLHRMYRVSAAYCSEGGLAPQIGDNDSGRVLPLCGRPSLDHGYLAPLGAAIFADELLKREADVFPEEGAWLLGLEGQRRFARLRARWKPRPFSSIDGGLHVLRGAGALVAVSAGAPGQRGVGGHSHNDRLSFELHLNGYPVIVDPGTGAYVRGRGLRDRLRGTAAHNTVQVDGLEQAPIDPTRLFALAGPACELRCRQTGARADRLVARYAANGVEVERTWVLDKKAGLLAVADRIDGRGMHQLSLRLHLPDTAVRLRPPSDAELRRAESCAEAWGEPGPLAAELGADPGGRAVVLFAGGATVSLEPAVYSPGYGELHEARCVLARARGRLPATLSFLVLFRRPGGTDRAAAES